MIAAPHRHFGHFAVAPNLALAVGAAVAAAVCYGIASVLQHRAAGDEEELGPLRVTLLFRLARRSTWLLGGLADVAAIGFQAVSLRYGPLALVQPLAGTGLLVAVPLAARLDHRRVLRREWLGAAAVVLGVTVFLLIAHPQEGAPRLFARRALLLAPTLAGAVAVCVLAAVTQRRRRAVCLAAGAGVLLGASAVLMKTVINVFAVRGIGVLWHWSLFALILVGGAGLLLSQNAFQAGALGAPLAALTIAEPVAGVGYGLVGLHERIATHGAAPVLEAAMALLAAYGVWLLTPRESDFAGDEARDQGKDNGKDKGKDKATPAVRS